LQNVRRVLGAAAIAGAACLWPFGAQAGQTGVNDWLVRIDRILAEIQWRAVELATDGIVLFALGLLFFVPILIRQLRALPRGYTFAFLGVTSIGAVLRLTLSQPTLLDAWPYTRCTQLARLIYDGPVLPLLGGPYYLTDIIFVSNLALAIATPCAIFAHARYLFRDPRIAVAAAGLLAVLPNHIRFARSDVGFISLILLSCLCFVTLHQALGDPSARRRKLSMAVLPLLCIVTFDSRPLACNLGPLLIATAWLFVPAQVPRGRRILATALVTLAVAYDIQFHLLGRHASQVHEGLAIGTFVRGFFGMFSHYNTLLHARVTPLGLTALAVAGAIVLWRRREPLKGLFLVAWLVGFYLTLGFVLSPITDMQARYHLHLVEPFVQLAAVGLVAALSWRRWAGIAFVAYAAAVPLIHIGFVQDVNFSLPAEFTFLTTLREKIPEGCTVLEYMGPDPGVPGDPLHLVRVSDAVERDKRGARWKVLSAGAPQGLGSPVHEEVVALLQRPPSCLYLYDGMRCYTEKPFELPVAPACAELRKELNGNLKVVAEHSIPNRVYDHEMSRGLGSMILEVDADGYFARPVMEDIPLRLYRVETDGPLAAALH
jgi:hypothetical protein